MSSKNLFLLLDDNAQEVYVTLTDTDIADNTSKWQYAKKLLETMPSSYSLYRYVRDFDGKEQW